MFLCNQASSSPPPATGSYFSVLLVGTAQQGHTRGSSCLPGPGLCPPLSPPQELAHCVACSLKSERSCLVVCPTLRNRMDCSLPRLLHPWDFPAKGTGVGCHFLLQGIFPTQGLNPGLPHCRQTLYRLSHQGSRHAVWEIINVC